VRDKITNLINQSINRETIAYFIVGICTSAVSYGTYALYARVFGMNEHIAKFLSMATAMVFAFYPNKVWVFCSRGKRGRELLHEIWTFFSTRAFSAFILEQGLFFVFIELIGMHDMIGNGIVMAIITVVNYLIAKLYVFNRGKQNEESDA